MAGTTPVTSFRRYTGADGEFHLPTTTDEFTLHQHSPLKFVSMQQMFISLHTIIVEYCLKFLIYFGLGFIDVEGNVFP